MAITASGIIGIDPLTVAADFRTLEMMYFPTGGFSSSPTKEIPIDYLFKRHQIYIYSYAEPGSFTLGPPNVLVPWQYEGEISLELQSSPITRYPISFNSANVSTTYQQTGTFTAPDLIRSRAAVGGYSSNPLPNCYSLFVDNRNTGLAVRDAGLTGPLEPAVVYLPANTYVGQIDKLKIKIDPTKFNMPAATSGLPSTLYVHIWIGINSYAN